jgi:hypothetical protein
MGRMNEAIARESRAKRIAIEEAKKLAREEIKAHNGDERQFNIEVDDHTWWIHLRLENRLWHVVNAERWHPRALVAYGKTFDAPGCVRPRTGIIYLALNIEIKKGYVGQTTRSIEDRQQDHYKASLTNNKPFYRAIRKYGWESFQWTILTEVDQDDLDAEEIRLIRYYREKTDIDLYNLTDGGQYGRR